MSCKNLQRTTLYRTRLRVNEEKHDEAKEWDWVSKRQKRKREKGNMTQERSSFRENMIGRGKDSRGQEGKRSSPSHHLSPSTQLKNLWVAMKTAEGKKESEAFHHIISVPALNSRTCELPWFSEVHFVSYSAFLIWTSRATNTMVSF